MNMSDDFKIGKVAEMTGLSVRKIKFYTGTTSKNNRDPKFFTPSGRTSRDNGDVKNWLFSKEDVRKIEYIHMLELLDYEVDEIRQIMQSEDYIGNTDFKKLIERIDKKIDLYQGFKAYVTNLSTVGIPLLDANEFSIGRMEDCLRLSNKRYGKLNIANQRLTNAQSDEFISAFNSAFSEFSNIRHLPLDSTEASLAADNLEAFTEMYFGSCTPLMMMIQYGLLPQIPGQAEIFDSDYGSGTVQYIADIVSMRYEERDQRLLQVLYAQKEHGIDSEEVKETANELFLHRFCLEKGKPDITFFLPVMFDDDSAEETDEESFASQVLNRHYAEPLKKAILGLANLRAASDQREAIEDRSIVLLGKIMELFKESLPESIEWITFIISEMRSIRNGIDRMAGIGSAVFVAAELKNRYDSLVRSILENMEL